LTDPNYTSYTDKIGAGAIAATAPVVEKQIELDAELASDVARDLAEKQASEKRDSDTRERNAKCDSRSRLKIEGSNLLISCLKDCNGATVFEILEEYSSGNIKEVKYININGLNFEKFVTELNVLSKNKNELKRFKETIDYLERRNARLPKDRESNLGRCEFKDSERSQKYSKTIRDELKSNLTCSSDPNNTPPGEELRYRKRNENTFVRPSISSSYRNSNGTFPSVKFKTMTRKEDCGKQAGGEHKETLRYNSNWGSNNDEIEYRIETSGFFSGVDLSFNTKCNFPASETSKKQGAFKQTPLQRAFADGIVSSLGSNICNNPGPAQTAPVSQPTYSEPTPLGGTTENSPE
jgi:hypothetical protein